VRGQLAKQLESMTSAQDSQVECKSIQSTLVSKSIIQST